MNNLLENLNPEQLEAVRHKDGPLLIIAGAGTGKTMAVTQRIAYLIEQGKVKSDEILALTFTEKAAGEMEERVDRLLPMGYLDLWISTFHSFGERILKENGLAIGLAHDFRLLNEFEQWALVRKNFDRFNLDYYRPLGNPTKFIHALIKHFSRCKDEDISPREYLSYAEELKENMDAMLSGTKKKKRGNIKNPKSEPKSELDKEIAEQEVSRINEVANAYHVYQQLLLDNSALDFGDLINYSLKLFRDRPAILAKYRQQFKYILLDEFQDTNWAQYELIKMLAAPKNNLTVVGDDDQSIYKFRGASVSNILQFKKDYPSAKEIVLINNYRNKQNILDLSYDFIQGNNPNRLECRLKKEGGRGLNKKLKAIERGKGEIALIAGEDLHDEARKVVSRIEETAKQETETTWNDFAILVRANDAANVFCSALETKNIPYIFLASKGLYAKPVVMDAIAYLRLLDNYHESSALYRILSMPIFNFSYQELVNFNYLADKKTLSLYEVLKDARSLGIGAETQGKISLIKNLIDRHTRLVRDRSASEVFLAFLNDSGYIKYLSALADREAHEAFGYLNQLLTRIRTFEEANDDKSVKAFLREFVMEIDAGEEGRVSPDLEAGPEAVRVMTIHTAKGLEFKHVFIVNMVDKRFPTIERKEAIAIPDSLVKETLPEGNIHLEEERRLFYVAATRAKNSLYFSWAPNYGGLRRKKPSQFLEECGLTDRTDALKDKPEAFTRLNYSQKYGPVAMENVKHEAPKYFSYSQIEAYSKCPYQYRFAHILKVPRRPNHYFSFGKTMHSALEKTFKLIMERKGASQGSLFGPAPDAKQTINLEEIMGFYEESWIDEWYEDKKTREEYRQQGREILKDFYGKHKDNWPNTVYLEKGFSFKIKSESGAHTIRGFIDRIDDEDGKLKIIDYKTGNPPREKLTLDNKMQLFIYQMAVSELFEQAIGSLSFYYLKNNSRLEFLGSTKELEKASAKIAGVIDGISQGDFHPDPEPHKCQYCDFSGICEFRKA